MIIDPKKVRVLNEKILIKARPLDKTTDGGIIVPDSSTVKANFLGDVIAVGEGYRNGDGSTTPLKVKEGDIVVIPPVKSDPFLIKKNNESTDGVDRYYILGEQSILAIVKE